MVKHIALFVPDLRAAEHFYTEVFGMDLLFREADLGDDDWYALPAEKGWDDAEQAGVQLTMVALRHDTFVLALFRGSPQPGTVSEICLACTSEERDAVARRSAASAQVVDHTDRFLRFDDPFGFRWSLQDPDAVFRSSGEIAGRWLDV